jgi:hypothetical protein
MRFLPRFNLSATQLLATALAAVTATVAASYLGVAGTVIGAAVVSVMSAIGNAVYTHSLRTTHARVREVVPMRRPPARPAALPRSAPLERPARDAEKGEVVRRQGWQRAAFGAVALFVALLTVITGVEIVTGRPISDLLRGTTGSGTTLFGDANANSPAPVPTVTQTVTPSVEVITPTVTQTAPAVTETATPTVTSSATPTPPASSTTPGPSGQPTP